MIKPSTLVSLISIVLFTYGCSSKSNQVEEQPADEPIQVPELDHSDSITGPDSNKNGIRDDIDTLIDRYPLTSDQRKSASQFALKVQSILVDIKDSEVAYNKAFAMFRAQACMASKIEDFSSYAEDLHDYTINTYARMEAYLKFQSLLGSASFPDVLSEPCSE